MAESSVPGAVGEHESDCRNKGIKVRCDDCGVLLSAGGAVGEREEPLDVRGGCYFCGATGPAPHAGCPAGNTPYPTDEDIEHWYAAFEKVSGMEAKRLPGRRSIFEEFAAEYAHLSVNEGGVAGAESRESDR